ncbi:hypothetical protein [Paramicrobacterium fandaimingii]|uniref:hypothetical protein n=1 Tax=Paramicrobacterium fandaimingii TaxID=2708079 RepID=UPI001420F176|nr:hypothetical protein [Microbacterium fandaimingii]
MADLSVITSGSYSRLSHRHSVGRAGLRHQRAARRQLLRRAFLSAAATHMAEIRRLVVDDVPADKRAELTTLLRPIADNLRLTVPRG